ncbi:ATP-binding protein [Streptomyces sp. NPDC001940]
MVLERQLGEKIVRFTPSDRAFLAALLHRLPRDVLNLESGHRLLGVGDKHAQLISPPFVWPCPVCRLRVTGLRRACVPEPWTLNNFDFAAQPGVDEKLIRDLATLRFLDDASNVLFVGPPGVCP